MRTAILRSVLSLAAMAVLLGACGGGEVTESAQPTTREKSSSRAKTVALPPGLSVPADANVKGVFGPLKPWPLIAVHGVVLPDGRVMSYGTTSAGQQTANFIYDVWNAVDDSHLTLANNTGTDIFCSSQLVLPDGNNVFIAGGDNWTGTATTNTGNNNTNLLNVRSNTLTRTGNMNRARWYSTSTTLLNGETYVQGGSGGADFPEVRQADGSFRLLSSADTSAFAYQYPRNFVAPDGRLFGYESGGRMYYVDARGTGAITLHGQFNSAYAGSDASAAMFAPGRILQYGGNSNQAVVIDITNGAPAIAPTQPMLRQRRLSVATILADGKVVATGGSRVWNQLTDVSYEAEIWNPANGQWTVGALAQRSRLYHGNALLMADGTVLVFGGGAPGPEVNTNAEVYYPPYLFNAGGVPAERPGIAAAPTVVDVGRTVQVQSSGVRPISRVTLVKTGSTTHGFNMEQRFVDLPFSASGNSLSVQIPGRASDVPPGMWMLFVIDDAGVPSEAKLLRINVANALNVAVAPTLTSPGAQTTNIGNAVNLALSATDPNGDVLTYSASGLPAGLSIDPATGRITGTATAAGINTVTLAASDGVNSASATVVWTITTNAQFTIDALPVAAPNATGTQASFIAQATGSNLRYRWSFGDGTPTTDWSTSPTATHTFTQPGVFYVTVGVTDASGIEQLRTVIHNVHLPLTAQAPAMSSALLLEPGPVPRLWVVNPDNDSVSVFDATTRAKLADVLVGSAPRTLARAADGSIWVANKGSATLSVIDAASRSVIRTVALPRASQPYGIAAAGNQMLVTLEAMGVMMKVDVASGAVTASMPVGGNPRHLSVAADGQTAYVSRFITPPLPGEGTPSVQTTRGGEVLVVNSAAMSTLRTITLAHSDKEDAENQGSGVPNYLGAAAISPDGTQAYVPSKQDNVKRGPQRNGLALNFQNTVRAISSRIDLAAQSEDLASRIDHDNASVASAAAYDPLGVYLFVALETSREVAVLDAHTRTQLMRIDVGRAPQALAVSSDRRTLYVHNFMDRKVGVHDLSPLINQGLASANAVATLAAGGMEKLTPQVLAGKQFFYDARDPRLARDRYMSCASCHNDGAQDGRVWDLSGGGEGLRNTISLRGRAGSQGRLHWSNNFDEVQDFEGQIRTLAGGTGLMSDAAFNSGTRNQPLGDRKAGASADLDALAAYLGSLGTFDASPSRNTNGTLTTLAQEGKTVFNNHGCATCHSAAAFTRSGIDNPANIGTLKPSSGQRLFGALNGIDVPTLRDVWATAPYLHDGSAPTLGTAVRAHTSVVVSDLDLDRVVAYLREIGSDEPTPATNAGGLLANYYNSVVPGGTAALTRTEVVDTDWGTGGPGAGVGADNFSARWSAKLVVPVTGAYVFQTESDDGVRAWVNGAQVINNWIDHGPTLNNSGAFNLTAGQQVDVVLEYYERSGGAVMRWRWQPPGAAGFTTVPAHYLIPVALTPPAPPPVGGLQAQYFSGVALGGVALLTRTEAVNFDWGAAAPGPGLPVDNFSTRWTGFVTIPATGSYVLRTLSDDGVRLSVSGTRRINNWTDHGPTYNTTASLNFSAGQKVPVTLEYYERGGGAVIRLEWRPPGSTSYVAIPLDRLSVN